MYMVPPFLAYYGVTTSNTSMLQEAYTQVCYFNLDVGGSYDNQNEQIVASSLIVGQMDYGSTSLWVGMGQTQVTGGLVC